MVAAKGGRLGRKSIGTGGSILSGLLLSLLLVLLGVDALVLLEILRTLEGLATDLARVRLERSVNTKVGGDVVPLGTAHVAAFPLAGEAEVVSALAADVVIAQVLVDNLGVVEDLATVVPSTSDRLGMVNLAIV